jgi:hypothetical protein
MKKTALVILLISALLLSAVAGTIYFVKANPYPPKYVSPDAYTKPPKISIFTPENKTVYRDTTIQLSINVSLPESTTAYETYVLKVYYEADWLGNRVTLYQSKGLDDEIASFQLNPQLQYFDYSGNISGAPRGNHSIVVYAEGGGAYPPEGWTGVLPVFSIVGSSSVFFVTGDQSPPKVMLLSIENKTYDDSNIPLNFTVNESCSQLSYVLDNRTHVIINGNVTLSGLSVGSHNLTVHAKDIAGNIGVSKTISFTVAKPEAAESFPAPLVIASACVVAVVVIGLFAYSRRKHHKVIELK